MRKNEKLENFIKLNKTEKKSLTLSWLIELIKSEHLGVEDVVDILNCVEPTFSKAEKLECLLLQGQFSTSTISRLFGFGYAKSSKLINFLVQKNLIFKNENGYRILDKSSFKKIIAEVRSGKFQK